MIWGFGPGVVVSDKPSVWQGPSLNASVEGPESPDVAESAHAGRTDLQRTVSGIKVIRDFAVAIVLTAAVLYIGIERGNQLDGLESHGHTTVGVVSAATETTSRSGFKTYTVDYEYRVEGATYRGTKSVDRSLAYAVRRGDSIPVTYDAAAPANSIAATSVATARHDFSAVNRIIWIAPAAVWGMAFWRLRSSANV
jgi:hypothetical protein